MFWFASPHLQDAKQNPGCSWDKAGRFRMNNLRNYISTGPHHFPSLPAPTILDS